MSNERTVVFHLPTVVAGSLAAISGTVAGRTYALTAGTFVIGRQPDLDLSLPTEPGVSKVHAKIVAEGDHYVLYDAESRNGTIVNGRPVQRVRLYDGDEVQVCGCTLRFTQTAGMSVQVKNPPSIDERLLSADPMAGLPVRGQSSASLARRDTGAIGLDMPPTTGAAPMPLPASALSPVATEHYPRTPSSPSLDAVEIVQAPRVVQRSAAPSFVIGMLLSMLGGGGVYAMYLMGDGREAQVAAAATADPAPPTTTTGAGAVDPTTAPAAAGTAPTGDAPGAAVVGETPPNVGEPAAAQANLVDGTAETPPVAAAVVAEAAPVEEPPAAEPPTEEAIEEPVDDEPVVASAARPKKKKRVKDAAAEAKATEEEVAPVEEAAETAPPAAEPVVAEETGAAAATAAVATDAPKAASSWIPVQVLPASKAPIRVASGGRVRSVDAAEGDLVVEGDTLVTFDQAVDAAEIATLKESIRALEAVVESGGSSEAEVLLKQEQDRLARLEAGQQQGRVSAPASGTLSGFSVKAGEKLRARQVIGTIVGANSRTMTATVDKDAATKMKKGSRVKLRSASKGEIDGVVMSTKKKGAKTQVTIEVVDGDAGDVDSVRLP